MRNLFSPLPLNPPPPSKDGGGGSLFFLGVSRQRRETPRPPINISFKQYATIVLVTTILFSYSFDIAIAKPQPELPVQGTWQNQVDSQLFTHLDQLPSQAWWTVFRDENLNHAMDLMLESNLDLKEAKARIQAAEAVKNQQRAPLFPQIQVAPAYSHQKSSSNLAAPSQSQLSGAGANRFFAPGRTVDIYQLPVSGSWSLDLFGQQRANLKSAQLQRDAVVMQAKGIKNQLTLQLATTYFNLSNAKLQLQLAGRQVYLLQDELDALQSRMKAGLVAEMDTDNLQGQLDDAKAMLADAKIVAESYQNQLAVLLARTPEEINALEITSVYKIAVPSELPVSIPSVVLTNRADIQAAELILKSADMNITAARRAFLPSVNITSQVGLATLGLGTLFRGGSFLYNAGSQLVQSLFTGGLKQANLKFAKANAEEKLAIYQKTIFSALSEIESTLKQLNENATQYDVFSHKYLTELSHLDAMTSRYAQGLVPHTEVSVLERSRTVVEKQQGQAKINLLNTYATLMMMQGPK